MDKPKKKRGNALIAFGIVIMLMAVFYFVRSSQFSSQAEGSMASTYRLLGFLQLALAAVAIISGIVKNKKDKDTPSDQDNKPN